MRDQIIKLKPCPFCGSENLDVASTNEHAHWIVCDDCDASAASGETLAEGVSKWNRRAQPKSVRRLVRTTEHGMSEVVEDSNG